MTGQDPTPKPRAPKAGRVAGAIALIALMAGTLALPMGIDTPEPQFRDIDRVDVSAGPLTLVCPAAPALTTSAGAVDVDFDDDLGTGGDVLDSRTHLAVVGPIDGVVTSAELGQDLTNMPLVFSEGAGTSPRVVQVPPRDAAHPPVGGLTLGAAPEGDLRGMVAGACTQPSSSAWLVGGDTEVGSSTQLVLTNPGETPARVKVQVWTALGRAAGEIVELVEPGSSTRVLAETLERTDRTAFHVTSEGGQVFAHLTTTTLDGIIPRGISYVLPGAPPAPETFVGPVYLKQHDDEDWRTELRIVNPGTEPAQVSVHLLGAQGEEALSGAQELTVDAGVVTQIPIGAGEPGNYTVRVESDSPVAASTYTLAFGEFQADVAGVPADASWLPSGTPASDLMLVIEERTEIAVSNPEPERVEVLVESVGADGTLTGANSYGVGPFETITLPDIEAEAIRISGATVLASAQYLDPSGPFVAAVTPAIGGTGGVTLGVVADN